MLSNTRSSIEHNKRKLYASVFTLLLVLIIPFFIDFKGHSQTSNASLDYTEPELKELIEKAEYQISFCPDSAELFAANALVLSYSKKRTAYIIRSLIVMGNVKKLKGDQSSALDYYTRAAELARQKRYIGEECDAILNIGEIIYKKGAYDQALLHFRKADSLAKVYRLENQEANALYFIGKYNQTKGNFDQAKIYYHRSLDLSRKNKDKKQLAVLLPSLGKYYISEGRLNLALQCYQEAFHLSAELNDQFLGADICNHLGGLYIELKEFDKAMYYHRKALQYRLNMNYPGELAKSYNNLGKIYFGLNKLDSAEYYFNRSLVLCKSTDYKKGLVKSLINLGEVYRVNAQLNKAAEYLCEAFMIAKQIGYDNGIAESSLDIGELFMDKNHVDSAIVYYNIALAKFGKANYNEDLLRAYKGLYNSYLSKQDHKKALEYHVSILETEKKLLDVENKRQLAIVNISFDTERKEQDYRVLLKDNELKASLIKSKNTFIWLIVAVLSFMVLLCLYVYNRFYIKKRANKKLEELNRTITNKNLEFKKLNYELELVNKEKDKLFSIISHELRNPLYWLQNLAEVLSRKYNSMPPEKIRKTVVSIDESAKNVYHLMDNLLHWSRSRLNRVHPKKLRHNLFILIGETTRMYETFLAEKEISFILDLPKDVYIYADGDLFACVIRNLLSNAIKYTPNGGKISLSYELGPYHITLRISDSGKGMSAGELKTVFAFNDAGISMPGLMQEKGSGLGLRLCKDFVEINGGKIWADSRPGVGVSFFFTVPLQSRVPIEIKELKRAGSMMN